MCSYPQGHRDPGEKQLKVQHHAVTRISPITARVQRNSGHWGFLLTQLILVLMPVIGEGASKLN